MNTTSWASAIAALVIGLFLGYFLTGNMSGSMQMTASSPKETALYGAMEKLWSDHVFWTREYITAFAAGNKLAADAAATRLLKNQDDIGAAVAGYYGADAGTQLTTLLKQHITQAVTLLSDAKAGKTDAVNADNAAWQQNADQIATLLASANPNWDAQNLKDMMQEHLVTTLDEATAELKGDHVASVAAFDKVYNHMLMMSDVLSAGIIKQFPDTFK